MTLSNCQLIYIIIEWHASYVGLTSLQMSHNPAAWATEGPPHDSDTWTIYHWHNSEDPAAVCPSTPSLKFLCFLETDSEESGACVENHGQWEGVMKTVLKA